MLYTLCVYTDIARKPSTQCQIPCNCVNILCYVWLQSHQGATVVYFGQKLNYNMKPNIVTYNVNSDNYSSTDHRCCILCFVKKKEKYIYLFFYMKLSFHQQGKCSETGEHIHCTVSYCILYIPLRLAMTFFQNCPLYKQFNLQCTTHNMSRRQSRREWMQQETWLKNGQRTFKMIHSLKVAEKGN